MRGQYAHKPSDVISMWLPYTGIRLYCDTTYDVKWIHKHRVCVFQFRQLIILVCIVLLPTARIVLLLLSWLIKHVNLFTSIFNMMETLSISTIPEFVKYTFKQNEKMQLRKFYLFERMTMLRQWVFGWRHINWPSVFRIFYGNLHHNLIENVGFKNKINYRFPAKNWNKEIAKEYRFEKKTIWREMQMFCPIIILLLFSHFVAANEQMNFWFTWIGIQLSDQLSRIWQTNILLVYVWYTSSYVIIKTHNAEPIFHGQCYYCYFVPIVCIRKIILQDSGCRLRMSLIFAAKYKWKTAAA